MNMLRYREFLNLTDEEIEFIINDIFHPVKVDNIQRDKDFNEITADITTTWNDGEENFNVTDEITLTTKKIIVKFSLTKNDLLKWQQFLLAKGCDYRLKDNPYLEE
ncbi:hypothetical protein [Blautia hansenii]|uniref:hypothetical protein n=1 Tax=Blautia hansenii TaxID=1322 RepID=UPI0022E3A975|nr:hypothetical protein [Blautia hansenii]